MPSDSFDIWFILTSFINYVKELAKKACKYMQTYEISKMKKYTLLRQI